MSLPTPLRRIWGRAGGPRVVKALENGLVPYAFVPRLWYQQRITLADFSPTAGTTQTLTLNSLFPNNVFPTDVDLMEGAKVRINALPTGTPTGLTLTFGGTFGGGVGADADGLTTTSNVLGGGAAAGDVLQTPAAARYATRYEAAFSPTIFLTSSGGNLDTLTSLDIEAFIPWTPRVEISS